jgi:hypothetical protein
VFLKCLKEGYAGVHYLEIESGKWVINGVGIKKDERGKMC